MKNTILILLALLTGMNAEARSAYNSYRMPSSGNLPGWGPIDLSQSGAVVNSCGISHGGTGASTQQGALNAIAGAVTSGQYLRGNGTNVVLGAIQAGDVPTLNQNTSGNAATVTTNANMTGPVTSVGNATSVTNNAITNAMLAQMGAHTFKGNNTGSTANALDLTATQFTAELNAFVGDSGSGGTKGLVPAPSAGDAAAGKYLKADGTFATTGTVTSVAVAVPAEFSVSGSPITGAGTITIGKANQSANTFFAGPTSGGAAAPAFRLISVNDFNSGTGASSSTFLRGDNTWAVPASGGSYAKLSEVQSMSTAAGTFTAGSWATRVLNTEVDLDGIVTLSSNQFTLAAGTYKISASAPGYRVDGHQTKIQNITDASVALLGTSETSISITGDQSRSFVEGQIIIAGTKTFELQHQCTTTKTSNGLGTATGITSEVYSVIEIWKVQ